MTLMTTGWKAAKTEYGDTLARIAARELGDASRWPELAWLNNLLPPYLTADPLLPGVASGRILVFGGVIRIPVAQGQKRGVTPAQSFGVDVRLTDGLLTVTNGDLDLAVGSPNLKQALELRLRNDKGCLQFHPKYGNDAYKLRGHKADANANLLALRFCEECLLGDPRVVSVRDGVATQDGDAIKVEVTAMINDGTPLRLQVEI